MPVTRKMKSKPMKAKSASSNSSPESFPLADTPSTASAPSPDLLQDIPSSVPNTVPENPLHSPRDTATIQYSIDNLANAISKLITKVDQQEDKLHTTKELLENQNGALLQFTKQIDDQNEQFDQFKKSQRSKLSKLKDDIQTCNDKHEGNERMLEQNIHTTTSSLLNLETKLNQQPILLQNVQDKNQPSITPIPDLQTPQASTYQLATKTVNVKTLCKQLEACSFVRDDPQSVHMTYMKISQAVDMACSTSSLFPSIHGLTNVPDFYKILVPQDPTSTFRNSIHHSYMAISICLFNFIMSDEAIGAKATIAKAACNELATNLDGFQYLGLILHRTLPQFGGPTLDLLTEMGNRHVNG